MQTKNNKLSSDEMIPKRTNKRKKVYHAPRIVVYGDFRRLTMGATGLARDGGAGSPKSKASGGT